MKQQTIKCKQCIQFNEEEWKPAITIWEGNAYCELHHHDAFMALLQRGTTTDPTTEIWRRHAMNLLETIQQQLTDMKQTAT